METIATTTRQLGRSHSWRLLQVILVVSVLCSCAAAQTEPPESMPSYATYRLDDNTWLSVGIRTKAEYVSTTMFKNPTPEQDTHDWKITTRYSFSLIALREKDLERTLGPTFELGRWVCESSEVIGMRIAANYPSSLLDVKGVHWEAGKLILCYEGGGVLRVLELEPKPEEQKLDLSSGTILHRSAITNHLVDAKLTGSMKGNDLAIQLVRYSYNTGRSDVRFERVVVGDRAEWKVKAE